MGEPQPPQVLGTMMRPAQRQSPVGVVVGLVLVLPALLALVVSYVWPALWTVRTSFQKVNILTLGEGEADSAGTDNYQAVLDNGFGASIARALLLAVVPLLVVLVAAPLLAWSAHRAGPLARVVTRGVLALPLACYAPAAIAAAWSLNALEGRVRDSAAVLRSAYWLGTFGLVTALAVTVYLAALRRRDPLRSPVPALAVGAGVLTLATFATVLQSFTYPLVTLMANRSGSSAPIVEMYEVGFVLARFGPAAAISTMVMAVLAVLGLAVTLLLVLTRARLEVDPVARSADDPSAKPVWLAVGGVTLLIVMIVAVLGLAPWLGGLFDGYEAGRNRIDAGEVFVNTWIPTLITSLVGVGLAALAAFGIGALRPFGRASEWLLLPFGLFLFVGVGPLALRAFAGARTSDRLGSFLGLLPPTWLAIPALFLLTLIFRGQAERYAQERQLGGLPSFVRTVVLPALPMVAIAFVATWLVQSQNLIWPLISSTSRDTTGAVYQFVGVTNVQAASQPYHLALGIPMLLLFVVLAVAAQVLYLNRVALRVGAPEREGGPRT